MPWVVKSRHTRCQDVVYPGTGILFGIRIKNADSSLQGGLYPGRFLPDGHQDEIGPGEAVECVARSGRKRDGGLYAWAVDVLLNER